MYDEYGNFYQDPRFDPSQGQYVTINADAGGEFRPITVGAPVGQYQTINADAGGQYVENTAAQQAAMNAQLEADRQAQLQAAAAYVAANPLSVSGNQIATRYGERDVSLFKPIVKPGEAITGSTPTQLVDPATNMPVFLSDPSNPYSFTYDNTGTPAISGTLEQQAALYRPLENKGVFGTIGGDFLEGIKDPYFRNFAIAAAAMAAAAALAPAAGAAGAGGSTAGGAGATAFPIDFGSTILTGGELAGTGGAGFLGGAGEILPGAVGTGGGSLGATGITGSTAGGFLGGSGDILAGAVGTGGETLGAAAGLSGSTAGGFLGGSGDILAGAAGTGGGSLGGTTLGSVLSAGSNLLSGSTGDLIKGGLALGGLAVADALKPDQPATTAGGSLTAAQLQALVDAMPSMIGQYSAQAQQAGTGQMGQGYTPAVRQAIAQLFPTFSLPTQGPFYGAGRFGEGYAPNAPIIKV
jgi:hypothetical protein